MIGVSDEGPEPLLARSHTILTAIGCPQNSLGMTDETARIHHTSRRRGGVAARGARAAARDAGGVEVPTNLLLLADEVIE
jgi:hypothetical protein